MRLGRFLSPVVCLTFLWVARALEPNGIASNNPIREQYLADLEAIKVGTSPPSPPRAPGSDANNTDDDVVILSYTEAQIERLVLVDVLATTLNDTIRALDGMPDIEASSLLKTPYEANATFAYDPLNEALPEEIRESGSGSRKLLAGTRVSPVAEEEVYELPSEDDPTASIENSITDESSTSTSSLVKSPPPPSYNRMSPPPPPTLYTPLSRQKVYLLPAGLIKRPKFLADIFTGCPANYGVNLYGAKGDGTSDDSAAFTKAAAALRVIYLPPGVYRIRSSITLGRSLVAGVNTKISVDSGITLTLNNQVYRAPTRGDAFFTGNGTVKFSTDVEVHPDWWLDGGDSDWTGLQAATDSCMTTCNVILNRIFYLSRQWYINWQNGVFGTRASMVVAQNNYGKGVTFRPGTYKRPFVVPSVRQFTDYCIKIQGGTTNVNVQVGTLSYCEQGVSFDTTTTTNKQITSATVAHVSAAQSNRYTLTYRTGSSSDAIRSSAVHMNFVLTTGYSAPSLDSSAVNFFGVPGTFSGNTIAFQAYDPAQHVQITQAVLLANSMSNPAPNVQLSVDTWLGGLAYPGKMITGDYTNLQSLLNAAGGMESNVFFDMYTDASSFVSLGTYGSAGVQTSLVGSTTQRCLFNSGDSLIDNLDWLYTIITSDWKVGEKRTFYFFSQFAQTGAPASKMRCLYGRWSNPGVVCTGFANLNSQNQDMASVTLENVGYTTIPGTANARVYVGIQFGP